MIKQDVLMDALNYRFQTPERLSLALTHPSKGEKNNQRLEFLGDAVLQLIVSDRLYFNYPSEHEGTLTQLRQRLVCEAALANAARKINLGAYLLLDRGAEASGVREQDSALADAMEAVLAAVYLDGGYEKAAAVIDALIDCKPDKAPDPKSALQEYLQAQKLEPPNYHTVKTEGPPHECLFTVAVLIGGKEMARGTEHSKKKAEQAAARQALIRLRASEG